MPYFRLFNRVTECINALERILIIPEIPLEVLREIGLQIEALKQAQAESEERYINR